jgi:hypothetical protein
MPTFVPSGSDSATQPFVEVEPLVLAQCADCPT